MKTISLILAVLIATPAVAREPIVVTGVGSNTCADFNAIIKRAGRQTENAYYVWAAGFWSLANLSRFANDKKFKDLTMLMEGRDHLAMYCHFHPTEPFYRATMEVYDETTAP